MAAGDAVVQVLRLEPVPHLGAARAVAEIGVQGSGEIHRGRALG